MATEWDGFGPGPSHDERVAEALQWIEWELQRTVGDLENIGMKSAAEELSDFLDRLHPAHPTNQLRLAV